MEFRQYQKEIIDQGLEVMRKHWMVYLAMEVRTGKTLTALGIGNRLQGINNYVFRSFRYLIFSIFCHWIIFN